MFFNVCFLFKKMYIKDTFFKGFIEQLKYITLFLYNNVYTFPINHQTLKHLIILFRRL